MSNITVINHRDVCYKIIVCNKYFCFSKAQVVRFGQWPSCLAASWMKSTIARYCLSACSIHTLSEQRA